MVEIRYKDQYEVSDLAGCTVGEARKQYAGELGIPGKAQAKLNGHKVSGKEEMATVLNDDDRLSFAVHRSVGVYLVAALLLTLVVTGGVFAYGFVNASVTLGTTAAGNDFAAVTSNTTTPVSWTPYGSFKGSISIATTNGTPIFDVDTLNSGYTGDLAITVSFANADTLAKCYRMLALRMTMNDSSGAAIDINESGGADANDYVMLTLDNGSVSMYPGGSADMFTVRIISGFYITHVYQSSAWSTAADYQPLIFCEVAQR